jgi:hypothetical protein
MLDALGSEEFTERKKVAIHLAEVMTLNAHGLTATLSLRGSEASTARVKLWSDSSDWTV